MNSFSKFSRYTLSTMIYFLGTQHCVTEPLSGIGLKMDVIANKKVVYRFLQQLSKSRTCSRQTYCIMVTRLTLKLQKSFVLSTLLEC